VSITSLKPSREWPAVLAIAAAFGAAWLLVGASADVPVIDDWVYAWSVEHLLTAGRLKVLDISAFYPIAQILWGAFFGRMAGFSFVALRLSTVTLSALGCAAVYLTLRELGCRRSTAILGAFALAFDPVYFALSFSFMTDVPFVSVSTMAMYWYVRAIRRDETTAVYAGCACALAAFLIRPIGIVLPLTMAPDLIRRRNWRTALACGTPLIITLMTMSALQIALPRLFGPLDWAAIRRDYLRWWFTVPMASYLRWNIEVVFVSVFPFAPLLLACISDRRRAIAAGALAFLIAIACRAALGSFVMPLLNGQTWSLHDIGARMMFDGPIVLSGWTTRLVPLVKSAGAMAVAALIVIAIPRWRRPWTRGETVIVTLALLQLVSINALWLFNDRYYLVLGPVLAVLVAQALDGSDRAQWVASAFVILWAGIAISGTRDMLAVNEAAAKAARELESEGIPPWEIDAGYANNGWRLYAHPEHLAPGANRRYEVPFVTSNRPTEYSIVNTPLPRSEIIRVVPLEHATWQSTRSLYIVRRPAAGQPAP
jgi:Dolichyl-phosphate-mannose-protein mannosyltransferase